MQHLEFFHKEHFSKNYHREHATGELADFIDFFWETRFEELLKKHPEGFSDVLYSNIGYTYIINLGTPFTMQVNESKCLVKSDCFLPRHQAIECFHQKGNNFFGIKFKISPVLFEKKVNFADYQNFVFPLSYLLDPDVNRTIRELSGFKERVDFLKEYFNKKIRRHQGSLRSAEIVKNILRDIIEKQEYDVQVEALASRYAISSRTLQRYFEMTTGFGSKKAIQVMRIRRAVEQIVSDAANFDFRNFGYYDDSHFQKQLKQFLHKGMYDGQKPHLYLLSKFMQ